MNAGYRSATIVGHSVGIQRPRRRQLACNSPRNLILKRNIIAIVGGLIAGFVTVALLQSISVIMYPMPEGLSPEDPEAMGEWVKTLPIAALLIVLASHGLGAFVAGCVSSLLRGGTWYAGAAGLGVFFLVGGIFNLLWIPHPLWFAVADLIIYVPAALIGAAIMPSKAVSVVDDSPAE